MSKFGKYELLEKLGRGALSEAHRARLPGVAGFEKIVTVKRLLPHLVKNEAGRRVFVEEAKLASKLQHKNLLQVHELGELDGLLFAVMERVDGADLATLLRAADSRKLRLPLWFSLHLASEVASALTQIHDLADEQRRPLQLIHGDVNPSNIFVSRFGDVKLGDFGVTGLGSLTDSKHKVAYAAPDELFGRVPDRRSDVFSAAVVLWECLAQVHLFGGRDEVAIPAAIAQAPRPPPSHFNPEVPADLDAIVLEALEADAEKRTPSAAAFQRKITAVLARIHAGLAGSDVRHVIDVLFGLDEPNAEGPTPVDTFGAQGVFTEFTPVALDAVPPPSPPALAEPVIPTAPARPPSGRREETTQRAVVQEPLTRDETVREAPPRDETVRAAPPGFLTEGLEAPPADRFMLPLPDGGLDFGNAPVPPPQESEPPHLAAAHDSRLPRFRAPPAHVPFEDLAPPPSLAPAARADDAGGPREPRPSEQPIRFHSEPVPGARHLEPAADARWSLGAVVPLTSAHLSTAVTEPPDQPFELVPEPEPEPPPPPPKPRFAQGGNVVDETRARMFSGPDPNFELPAFAFVSLEEEEPQAEPLELPGEDAAPEVLPPHAFLAGSAAPVAQPAPGRSAAPGRAPASAAPSRGPAPAAPSRGPAPAAPSRAPAPAVHTPVAPAQPNRRVVTSDILTGPGNHSPVAQLMAASPWGELAQHDQAGHADHDSFWLKSPEGKITGPVGLEQLRRYLSHARHSPGVYHLSGDGSSWLDVQTFAKLCGQEYYLHDPGPAPARELEGDLRQHPLRAILAAVAQRKGTGRIVVVGEGSTSPRRREIHVDEGQPTYVYSNELELQIPALLVRHRVLTLDHLPSLLHEVLMARKFIDMVVSKHGNVDMGRLWPEIMFDRLEELLEWRTGRFYFDPKGEPWRHRPFARSLESALAAVAVRSSEGGR